MEGSGVEVTTLPAINHRTDDRTLDWVTCDGRPEHSYQNWNISWGFKSRHPGGANFLFADGSVRFLSEELQDVPRQYLGCRNDRQITPEDE